MSEVFKWLDRVSKCGCAEAETAAKILKDYYEGAGQPQPKNQLNVTFSVDMTSMLNSGISKDGISTAVSHLLRTSDLKFTNKNLQTSIWYNQDVAFYESSEKLENVESTTAYCVPIVLPTPVSD